MVIEEASLAVPDVADRHRRYIAMSMLAFSALSLANAAQRAVPESLVPFTEYAQVGFMLLIFAGLAPMALWKLRNRDARLRQLYWSEDGFAAHALQRSKTISWIVTFVALALATPLTRRWDGLPPEFFLYLTSAVMTGVFAVAFLALDRDGDDGAGDPALDA